MLGAADLDSDSFLSFLVWCVTHHDQVLESFASPTLLASGVWYFGERMKEMDSSVWNHNSLDILLFFERQLSIVSKLIPVVQPFFGFYFWRFQCDRRSDFQSRGVPISLQVDDPHTLHLHYHRVKDWESFFLTYFSQLLDGNWWTTWYSKPYLISLYIAYLKASGLFLLGHWHYCLVY